MVASFYKEEHRIFRKEMKDFVDKEIRPNAQKWEEERGIPRELWYRMGELGFLCPWVDEKYGGSGAGFEYSVIIHEELARSEVSGAGLPAAHSDVVVPYIYHHGTEEQKQKYLPGCVSGEIITSIAMSEPEAGSDLASIRTTAVKDGDDYIVNGQKIFITNGTNCDLAVTAVKTDPKADPPYSGISILLIEAGTPGFTKGPALEKVGAHSQDTGQLYFDDCRVPTKNLLGNEGDGFQCMMYNLQQERLIITLGIQAAAEYILEKTIEYCKSRQVFGRPVTKFQHNTFKIVELATEVELGRTFLDSLTEEFLEGKDINLRVSMAKWWIGEMVNRLAYHCTQLHGGYGFMKEYFVARSFVDVRPGTIAGGTTEVMKLIIGKMMGL